MVALLVNLIILVVIFGVLIYLARMIPLPEPFGKVVLVLLAVVFLLVFLGMLTGGVSLYMPRM